MSNALHIGVKPLNIPAIRKVIFALGYEVFQDGDGWNAWGELPGTDVNDPDTRHLVIGPFAGPKADEDSKRIARMLTEQHGDVLVPMGGYPQQVGVKAHVSDWDEWSEREVLSLF